MKNFLLLLIVIFMSINANAKPVSYKVLSIPELNRIEEEKRSLIDTQYILDYNAVFVTIFKDGTATLRPPVLGGEEALLFYDIEEMNKMIASKVYPVKGLGTFWEKEKERIENLPTFISYYCGKLSKMLNFNVEVKDDPAYLKHLSAIISEKLKKGKRNSDLNEYLSIYIGELLRERIKGDWILFTEHTFHNFYVPRIIKEGMSCDIVGVAIGELQLGKYVAIDLDYIIESARNRFLPYNQDRYIKIQ